jgi:hypothetical protein
VGSHARLADFEAPTGFSYDYLTVLWLQMAEVETFAFQAEINQVSPDIHCFC